MALTAAGTVALSPLAPVMAQSTPAPAPSLISVGTADGFVRIEISERQGRVALRRTGNQVVVRVPGTQPPDISRLSVDRPAALAGVTRTAVAGGHEIVLTLAEGAGVRLGRADGVAYVNLHQSAPPPEAQTRVPVRIEASDAQLDLSFGFTTPTPAAVFRRGPAVWIVFDTPARLDLGSRAGTNQPTGPASEIRWAGGEGYVAVRISAPETLAVSARQDGQSWSVRIGGPREGATGVSLARDDLNGPTALVAQMAGASRALWLTDPLIGDRFAAVPAIGPAKGLGARRQLVDLTLLPSAHGLALEARRDDLSIVAAGDLVRVSRPGGLALSSPVDALSEASGLDELPARARLPALILESWADTGHGSFLARYRQLQDAAAREADLAASNPRAPVEARLALARFLVGSQLGFEAIGALNALMQSQPGLGGEAEIRGLRGAARAMIGRFGEAQSDFAASALSSDASASVWRGYIAARQRDWTAARQGFVAGARTLDDFPPIWRARFGTAHAEAAIETGDLNAARTLLAYVFSQDIAPAEQLRARLVQARLFELAGEPDRALAVYRAVGRAPLDALATPARMNVVRLELARGTLTPDQAVQHLEPLRWRWRGDATELAVIRTLGGIYLAQGRYREALDALRSAGARLPNLPEAVGLQQDLATAFRALFLEGGADGLQPVQALALFYDFRELTPVGAEGDDMVRRLARRLIDVDLLDAAGELLQHQVDNRLEGVARAQVATDLATVYVMNREPEQALQALWSSRTTLLPAALNSRRRAIEARALMDLSRYEHALEVLGTDTSSEAQDVRAEVLWRQQAWADAARIYEARLAERWRQSESLNADEEARLLRAGIGYVLSGDGASVARLGGRYGALIAGARQSAAMRIVFEGGEPLRGQDVSQLAARTETFTGWVNTMKSALRARLESPSRG